MMKNNVLLIMLNVSFVLYGMEHGLSQTDRNIIIETIKHSSTENCYCIRGNTKETESAMFNALNDENKEKYICWMANKIKRLTRCQSQYLNETIFTNFFWKSLRKYRNDIIECSTQDSQQENLYLNQKTNIVVTEPCLDTQRVTLACLSGISIIALCLVVYRKWLG